MDQDRVSDAGVTVRVFGGLRELAQRAPLTFPVADVPTLAALLAKLDDREPVLAKALRSGLADGYLNTLVNGRNARFLDGEGTRLSNGDAVAFLPPIGGG